MLTFLGLRNFARFSKASSPYSEWKFSMTSWRNSRGICVIYIELQCMKDWRHSTTRHRTYYSTIRNCTSRRTSRKLSFQFQICTRQYIYDLQLNFKRQVNGISELKKNKSEIAWRNCKTTYDFSNILTAFDAQISSWIVDARISFA